MPSCLPERHYLAAHLLRTSLPPIIPLHTAMSRRERTMFDETHSSRNDARVLAATINYRRWGLRPSAPIEWPPISPNG